ncbi:NAD(P)/FAD-dependent oxidoreductase [Candidatus Margulisiibacteriota bacterium]
MKLDVLIIGGGVTGTAIARELSHYQLKVMLLEKETELAFGVSKSNSGIVHPGSQNSPKSLKGKLCVEGNKLMRKIAKELGVHFEEVGELIVIFKKEEIKELERLKREGEELGVPGLEIVDQEWLRKNEPNLNKEAIAALYAPTAGIISPYRLVYDLAENAAKNGVEINLQQKVIAITKESSGFSIHTERTKYKAKYVINAAGLFADDVSRMVGIDDFVIKPRKGEEYLLDKKREHIVNHILFPLPTPVSKGVLVIKTSDGNPMIGPTAEEVESKEDKTTSNEGLQKVLVGVQKMVPTISDKDIIAYFSGLRPAAGKDFIIRHEDKVPGFINVAGIQSPGLTAAPAIAVMVSKLLKKNGLKLTKKEKFIKHRPPTKHLFDLAFAKIKQLIKKDKDYGDMVCRCEMVSAKEVREAIKRGARTMDGIKFRTRAQAGRCHGGFCTTRIMKILSEELKIPLTEVSKRGKGSELVKEDRANERT